MNLKRLKLIIDIVSVKRPTLNELLDSLAHQHDIEVSTRTLMRDFQELADDFSLVIKPQKIGREYRYYIDQTESLNVEETIRFFSEMELSHALEAEFKKYHASNRIHEFISFYGDAQSSGSQYLKSLLMASVQGKVVRFKYKKYRHTDWEQKTVHPYFLRQQAKNWYLFAKDEKKGEYRIYGLDRISEMSVTDQTFSKDDNVKPHELFNNKVGVYYDEGFEPITITMKVFSHYRDMIQHVPIHHSQRIVETKSDHMVITVCVVPDMEFFMELMRYRYNVEVIQPAAIVDEMKSIIQRMAVRYGV